MLVERMETLSAVAFVASDSAGNRKTFTSVDDFEAWSRGRRGVSVSVVSINEATSRVLN